MFCKDLEFLVKYDFRTSIWSLVWHPIEVAFAFEVHVMTSRFALGVLFVFLGISDARADLVLGLQTSGPLTVNSGDTVFVDLVISDTDNSTPLQAEGLFAAGGRILKAAGTANATVGAITDTMSYWVGGFFDPNAASSGPGTELAKVAGVVDFAALAGAGVGNTSITIARFAFQITGAAGSSIELLADRLNPSPTVAITTFGPISDDLDDLLTFDSLTFTVNGTAAVPEPASMILASLTAVVAGGAQYARRRRLRRAEQV